MGTLKFGFVPPQPRIDQVTVTRESVSHLPFGMQFLADKQCSPVPILPVQTPVEIKLYSKCIAQYLIGSSYDFEKLCYDWNNGLIRIDGGKLMDKPEDLFALNCRAI